MNGEIPNIVELIYRGLIPGPNPDFWPDHLQSDPMTAHSMWTFYRGLQMGIQLTMHCMREY